MLMHTCERHEQGPFVMQNDVLYWRNGLLKNRVGRSVIFAVRFRPSSVNFLHFHLLLENAWLDFNQT